MPASETNATLVMGARGSVGRHVLAELVGSGLPVRASARRLENADLPSEVDAVEADLVDPASLDRAFDGIKQVFLYAVHSGLSGLLASARRAGVERLVLMSSGSVVHRTSRGNAIAEEHRRIEDTLLAASDLTVIPIRPFVLASNALNWSHPIKAGSSVGIYKPDARTAPMHERDIAAVAASALRGDGDVSEMLTGPQRLTQREQVAAISAAIERPVMVEEQSRSEALAQLSRFMPPSEAEAVLQFLDDADAGNSLATDAVARILGRTALTFDVWARDHAGDFARIR